MEQLDNDLKDAMRSGDERKRSALRMVRAGIKSVEKTKSITLDDAGVIAVINKEVRERKDSLAEFSKANRSDLVEKEEAELAILLAYLPQQLSREEIAEVARAAIAQVGAQSAADKAKVMPLLVAQLKGKADGRDINAVVSELLG